MPEFAEEIDETQDATNESNLVRDLRKQIEKRNAELAAAKAEVEKFRSVTRAAEVSKALADAGIVKSDGAAKFYPSDADTSPEAIKAWLEGDGSVFAPADGTNSTERPAQASGQGEQRPLPPEVQASWQAIQSAEQRGQSSVTPIGPDAIKAWLNGLAGKSYDEISEAYKKTGNIPV